MRIDTRKQINAMGPALLDCEREWWARRSIYWLCMGEVARRNGEDIAQENREPFGEAP